MSAELIADRFDWPIAAPGDEQSRETSPDTPRLWVITNPYKNKYWLGSGYTLHTGIDWLIVGPADEYAPIYAVANGVVVAVKNYKGTSWGKVIIIRHQLPDGRQVWSRYAHIANPAVVVDLVVRRGDKIAECGNADGYYARSAFHLHFDIAITAVMEKNPGDWPGLDLKRLERDYVDPRAFIKAHRTIEPEDWTDMSDLRVTTVAQLNLRYTPTVREANVVRRLPRGSLVRLAGIRRNNDGYTWELVVTEQNSIAGWCADQYLGPVQPPTGNKFGLNFIGPGSFGEATSMIDRLAKAGKPYRF